ASSSRRSDAPMTPNRPRTARSLPHDTDRRKVGAVAQRAGEQTRFVPEAGQLSHTQTSVADGWLVAIIKPAPAGHALVAVVQVTPLDGVKPGRAEQDPDR